jgi:hypothetical protein
MVIPLGAPEVADLIHHSLELVVHGLWLFSFVEDEPTEFSLDCFLLGDLGYFVPFILHLEDVPNFFGSFQPLHLVVLLSTQGSKEYGGGLGVEMSHLGGDEDITSIHTINGLITRSHARQLILQVRSTLVNCVSELTLGAMDVLMIRNLGEDQQGLGKDLVVEEEQQGRPQ